MVKRGHNVTVYCTNLLNKKQKIQEKTFEVIKDGIRVVYFNTWNFGWWPGTLGPFWLPDLNTHLNKEIKGFDIVHLNGYRSLMMLLAARAARKANIPIVMQPHGTLGIGINSLLAKRIYDKIFGKIELRGISALIALQQSEAQQALSFGFQKERIEIIRNGICPEIDRRERKIGEFRKRFNLDQTRPLILFLARINKIKGTDMLIHAFKKLNMDVQLVIAGPDDGQLDEVKKLIGQYGLKEKVVMTGLLSGTEVLSAFQDADIFALPSRRDAFPVTIMEACLTNTPMVITDRCEIAHLVNNYIGEVVAFDADEFAEALKRLLVDKQRYGRYRNNCKHALSTLFSIEKVVDKLEAVYDLIISEKFSQ